MNEALRNTIWNIFVEVLGPDLIHRTLMGNWERFANLACMHEFKVPVDLWEPRVYSWIREQFFASEWFHAYNLLELLYKHLGEFEELSLNRDKLLRLSNALLEREMSGYRFVDGELVPITNAEEVKAIESVLELSDKTGHLGVNEHIRTALELMGKKPTPDYRNSIKESISAVESAAKKTSGESSGGLKPALEKLEREAHLNPTLKQGFLTLYGYTSGDDGIRHAMMKESSGVGFEEAQYMLVSCSAFAHYLISKYDSSGRA